MAGTTTIQDIARYFDTDGFSYELFEDKRYLSCGFSGVKGPYRVVVQASSSGRLITFMVREFDYIREKRRAEALEALMAINYTLNCGAFGMDISDGEVVFQIGIPVDETPLSYEQYDQSLRLISYVMDTYRDILKMVIWGNVDPKLAIEACEVNEDHR